MAWGEALQRGNPSACDEAKLAPREIYKVVTFAPRPAPTKKAAPERAAGKPGTGAAAGHMKIQPASSSTGSRNWRLNLNT